MVQQHDYRAISRALGFDLKPVTVDLKQSRGRTAYPRFLSIIQD
jgi:hypothetical protein